MIFAPDLAAAVMEGRKTVTRRPLSANPRSPWWRERCALTPGSTRAVQPGRGQRAIGRVRIVGVQQGMLGRLTIPEARAEGFPSPNKFTKRWMEMHGAYDPAQLVWRVEFRVCDPAQQEVGE